MRADSMGLFNSSALTVGYFGCKHDFNKKSFGTNLSHNYSKGGERRFDQISALTFWRR
jgi:hypothetical protein